MNLRGEAIVKNAACGMKIYGNGDVCKGEDQIQDKMER